MSAEQITRRSVSAHLAGTAYTTEISTGGHRMVVDEPAEHGGRDEGPRPHELLLGALASCIAITLKMYAGRKEWDTGEIRVDVSMARLQTGRDISTNLEIEVDFEKELSPEQRERLLQIARSCPVHRTLESPIHLTASLKH